MTARGLAPGRLSIALLGTLAALLVLATGAGWSLPLVRSDRAAFVALAAIGIAMCVSGMEIDKYGWLHPVNVAGIAVGALAALLIGGVLTGARLPAIPNDRAALLVLAMLMALKIILAEIRRLRSA